VEVLTIAVPFQALIEWLANITFFERFSDPETTCGRMVLPGFVIETADPSTSPIIAAISPEHLMYPIDQISRAVLIFLITGPVEQFKEVADCECIGPQVSLLILRRRKQSGSRCEFRHQSSCDGGPVIRVHFCYPLPSRRDRQKSCETSTPMSASCAKCSNPDLLSRVVAEQFTSAGCAFRAA
jgi:hypothetical protein